MTYIKRAFISIKRNIGKNFLLLMLFLILGILMSGAISVRQAISNTESSLLTTIPSVSTIYADMESLRNAEIDDPWQEIERSLERITLESVQEIANLSYVKTYDFSLSVDVLTREINQVFAPSITSEIIGEQTFQNLLDTFEPLENEELITQSLYGVHREEITDISTGTISITSGQSFTQEQIDIGTPVALISTTFANENNLQVGSVFNLETITFDYRELMVEHGDDFWGMVGNELDYIHLVETWELTVGGIFEIEQEFDYINNPWLAASSERRLQNRIYLPNRLVQEIGEVTFYANQEFAPLWWGTEGSFDEIMNHQVFFVLHDPRDLNAFRDAANELLPEFLMIADLSNNFHSITASMDSLLWIADGILYATLFATVVLVSILVILFLYDRKHEIGILLALGERKKNIVLQVLIEISLSAFIAICLAIYMGNFIAEAISNQMLETRVIQQLEENDRLLNSDTVPFIYVPFVLETFNSGQLSVEEMLATYDVSLNRETIATFFVIGLTTILISTTVPIIYLLRLDPKKILA